MNGRTATRPAVRDENDVEVFAPTVPEIAGEACDSCGENAVAARYNASKNGKSLYFCGHHIRSFATGLRNSGFTITPEDISYEAGFAK